MIGWLLGAHLAGVAAASVAGRASMRSALLTAAIAPTATAIWAGSKLAGDHRPAVHELTWVDGLDLTVRFRTDSLALMLTVLVSGIGALVFVYAAGYFSPKHTTGATLFPASLLAFSASMLGLVLADSIWTLFIFWELTSVTSFLLVGHKHTDPSVRTAARRALLITGSGGLVLLAGLVVLADQAQTTTLTGLAPLTDGTATVAAILILVGAATKSAQVPFHVWLPGAMAAPTPVSAYLHSATMVKAGVILVAVTGPAFSDVGAWKALGLGFGIASMMWGAVGALRHRDAKLILAWGTVSQLGLMITLFSLGTSKAVFAGVAILLSHALFKAALFLVVGDIDIRTGTRDIAELGGLWKSMPVTFAVAVAAALSMAGAPPLLGFMAKEAAIEAVLQLSGTEQAIAVGAVVVGSVLTVAYTVRFVVTVFGPGPDTQVASRRALMTAPMFVLGVAGVVGYFAVDAANRVVTAAAIELSAGASAYELIRWPGLKIAFVVSMGILAAGTAAGLVMAQRITTVPAEIGATRADRTIDSVLGIAPRITARIQHGSLPVYLATLAAAATAAAIPFLGDLSTDHLIWWDQPVQAALAVAIIAAAVAGSLVGSRLGAALTLGAVGIGVSGLFVVHGAPDLALTQLLVETIVVVGFVIGLGHLGRSFPPASSGWRTIRIALAVLGGLATTIALAASGSEPTGQAPIEALTDAAVDEGGGNNVVNVVLTDIRALDTLGEVIVLATVAVGVLALAKVRRGEVAA